MAENGIDAIAMEIRNSAAEWYPGKGEARAVRVVSRTPRNGHYVYELAVEFNQQAERVAVKLYRAGRIAAGDARKVAAAEYSHLRRLWEMAREQELEGIPRPLGDFSSRGAVANEKLVGVPLQSMILKAALIPGYAEVGQLQDAAAASGSCAVMPQSTVMTTATPSFPGLVETFPGNLASFAQEGLMYDDDGAHLVISEAATGIRPYRSGAFASARFFEHGRFEAEIRAAAGSGLVTGFFLHRDAPRQEIDLELPGDGPRRMLINV